MPEKLPSDQTSNLPLSDREAMRVKAFEAHRRLLLSIAYRMLGSYSDAEDMVQETFVRWQQAADTQIRSTRAFLVTIMSRLCINHLQSARIEREEYVGEWLPEPLLTGPLGAKGPMELMEIDESLSIAFLMLLERLKPIERAVFLLREVFDYEYEEIAKILERKEDSCRQLLRRARQHIQGMRPRFEASCEESERLLREFQKATASGDLRGLMALLSEGVVFHSDGGGKAPALPKPIYGPQHVARAILGSLDKFVPKMLVSRTTTINGQPGILSYWNGQPYAVIILDVSEGLIQNLYVVTNPDKLARLGPLPPAPC